MKRGEQMVNDVLVVGLNPALDRTIVLEKLEYAKTNTAKSIKDSAGGKATNVAMALKNLQVDLTITGISAGSNGEFIKNSLERNGLKTDFIKLPGQTRVNYKIFSKDTKTVTEINDRGQVLDQETAAKVLKFVKARLEDKKIVVLSGSIPTGFTEDTYLQLIEAAKSKGARVILDTNAKLLGKSIAAGPYAIKPNHEEIEQYACKKLAGVKEIAITAKEAAHKNGIDTVVVSLGKKGAVGYRDQKAFYVSALEIIPVNTVGAGDSMVAAMVYCMLKDISFRDTLAMMVAYSALTSALDAGVFAPLEAALQAKKEIIVQEIFL
jgi:1-phosphofructokinase